MIIFLLRLWRTEANAPEILPYNEAVVTSLMDQLNNQQVNFTSKLCIFTSFPRSLKSLLLLLTSHFSPIIYCCCCLCLCNLNNIYYAI